MGFSRRSRCKKRVGRPRHVGRPKGSRNSGKKSRSGMKCRVGRPRNVGRPKGSRNLRRRH